MFGKYTKAVTSLIAGVLGTAGIIVASPTPGITGAEWLLLAWCGAAALGVARVTNPA